MRVFNVDGVYKATWISGPSHCYLGIRFGEFVDEIEVVDVIRDKTKLPTINPDQLTAVVLEAASEPAHDGLGSIQRIEYVSDDTWKPDIYKEMFHQIVSAMRSDQPT